MLRRSAFREIRSSLGRYIAIIAIIALGVGFFAGLRVTKTDMVKTTDTYVREHGLFDYRLLSTVGYDADDVAALAALDGVHAAEGSFSVDFLTQTANGNDLVLRAHSITDVTNTLSLVAGRLPEKDNECVLDARYYTADVIGSTVGVSELNDEDTLELFRYDEYEVVGLVNAVYYLNYERGSTALGTGSVFAFVYMPYGGFDVDYFTDISLLLSESGYIYSSAYEDAVDAMEESVTDAAELRAEIRFHKLTEDAEKEIADAESELADGWEEYESERAKAEQELADAKQELEDGEAEIAENEQKLADAKAELADAEAELADGWASYEEGLAEYQSQRADAEKELSDAEEQLLELRRQVNDGFVRLQGTDLDAAEAELNAAKAELANAQSLYRTISGAVSSGDLSEAELAALGALLAEAGYLPGGIQNITIQELSQILQQMSMDLKRAQSELDAAEKQLNEAKAQEAELYRAQAEVDRGFLQLQEARREAEQRFADAEDELAAAYAELMDGEAEIADAARELADGEAELADARQELADGWREYEDAKAEADEKLSDAYQELRDGEAELADARRELADLEEPDVYVLDRSTNVGYVCFESDSDIIEAVSRVFPAFFFFVAALVCITTMTRMVDEQRTQIGVLKALGYTNFAIMSKFMIYSGSASLIGCILGFIGGSIIFPKVLWSVYDIMYGFADIILVFDNGLAVVMIAAFLFCALGATWFACRNALADVPAELMRPKSPKSGKRVLLERIPLLWNRMKFLHKVSIRNIFRYKKRLVMMILGISGCTALLITGFGIRDSIKNVADYQFNEISLYDYTVTLSEGAEEETAEQLREAGEGTIADLLFVHESSIDLVGPEETKSVNLVVCDGNLDAFLDLHYNGQQIAYPGPGEVVICDALAERLGIAVGDMVTLRTSDMKSLEVRVSAIFQNYVFYYVYVNAETCEAQWGYVPEYKTGYVTLADGEDVHSSAAKVMDADGVTAVSVAEDLRDRVVNMMSSLDYIVLLIVCCAAMLALIVLYNLTNINITERIREIATIKVLGFTANETASYVFRENILLTAMGALVGIVLGKLLHMYVMNQIRIDMISFDIRIAPLSMLLSLGLTFVFTLGVNLLMRIKLDKVNMAESLKSIE